MEHIKSNEKLKKLMKRNVFYQLLETWKKDVDWYRKTKKEKAIIYWFVLSFFVALGTCTTIMFVPALTNFLFSLHAMNIFKIKVEE